MGAVAALLPDGRLHLQHGPIDIVAGLDGPDGAVRAARAAAAARFSGLLQALVAELPLLRAPLGWSGLRGGVARQMAAAVRPFRPAFVTPMAAVAGAVADEVLAAALRGAAGAGGLTRAHVNNGGDIALWLAPGAALDCALAVTGRDGLSGGGTVAVRAGDGVGGIATSGWRGRSFSFGIADAVTVLARSAAMADAAATMIANAVDLPGHPAIGRRPAVDLQADSDLGPRAVTVSVGPLDGAEVARALAAGLAMAERCRSRGLIEGAALFLQGASRQSGGGAITLCHMANARPAIAPAATGAAAIDESAIRERDHV